MKFDNFHVCRPVEMIWQRDLRDKKKEFVSLEMGKRLAFL